MARVDPDDDDVERHVVRHYVHDPPRRQWRHAVVAAFDDEAEFMAAFSELSGVLAARRATGEPVDPREHYTGITVPVGHRRRAADGRLARAVFERGVRITDEFLAELDLPPGVGFIRTCDED